MKESDSIAATPTLILGERIATLQTPERVLVRFRVRRVDALTLNQAERVAEDRHAGSEEPVLVSFRTASPQARTLLRESGLSYAADDGERFLLAPGVYVERPATRRSATPDARARSPFAPRASRVPRWLLLHAEESPSLTELARAVALSPPTVSRTAAALTEAGLTELVEDQRSGRIRRLRIRDADALLDALERSRWLARARRQTWSIGAHDAAGAFALWRQSAERLSLPYAIGGPAGASLRQPVLEPADVLTWIREQDLERWREDLLAEPARPARGSITVALAPDPFILELTDVLAGLRVADPVQLYLDCRRAGERALEAAEAIRVAMGW